MSKQCCKHSSVDVLFLYLMSCRSASLAPSTLISLAVSVNPNCFTLISLTKNGCRLGTPYLRSPETHSFVKYTVRCAWISKLPVGVWYLHIAVFDDWIRDVSGCSEVSECWSFRWTYCLHLTGLRNPKGVIVLVCAIHCTWTWHLYRKIGKTDSLTRYHTPEDMKSLKLRWEKLKSLEFIFLACDAVSLRGVEMHGRVA